MRTGIDFEFFERKQKPEQENNQRRPERDGSGREKEFTDSGTLPWLSSVL